jgi:hypothetical protein
MKNRSTLAATLSLFWIVALFSPPTTPTSLAADPQVGDKITKVNMDEYDAYLPPSVRNMLELGMTIEVSATESCPWPELFIDATEKYASQVELSEDNLALHNYIAGMPFPTIDANDPDAAWKIMWNHEHKPAFSDDVRTEWVVENMDDRGFLEKMLSSEVWRRLKWEGRIVREPKPIIEHSPPMRYTTRTRIALTTPGFTFRSCAVCGDTRLRTAAVPCSAAISIRIPSGASTRSLSGGISSYWASARS